MKHVVVLGGGFGGVSACLELLRKAKDTKFQITLIDRNSYHLFTPSLYEVATSEMPQKNIAIPVIEIFGSRIEFLQKEVEEIDPKKQMIMFSDKTYLTFDYLLISLGSETAFYNIEGLKKHSLTLKTIADAVKIRNTIHKFYDIKAEKKEVMRVIIGGGGFSGTELAAELTKYREKLGKVHHFPENIFEIRVIQGENHLLKELDEKVSKIAEDRMQCEGVQLSFGGHIKKVTKEKVHVDTGGTYEYDVFIWTGGVMGNALLKKSGFATNKSGQASINSYLQTEFPHIFAIGDAAEFIDPKTGKVAPGVVQVAKEQAIIAAKNIVRHGEGKTLLSYNYNHFGYFIPLKGMFAVVYAKHFKIVGFLGWILEQFVFLRYFVSILPLNKAFRRWNELEKDLGIN